MQRDKCCYTRFTFSVSHACLDECIRVICEIEVVRLEEIERVVMTYGHDSDGLGGTCDMRAPLGSVQRRQYPRRRHEDSLYRCTLSALDTVIGI